MYQVVRPTHTDNNYRNELNRIAIEQVRARNLEIATEQTPVYYSYDKLCYLIIVIWFGHLEYEIWMVSVLAVLLC